MNQRESTSIGLVAVSLLTLVAIAIAGYHPFVEDGGVYAAGIEKLLNPSLFPTWTAFVTEHLRFSLFAPLVAAIVRVTHLSLAWALLLLYGLSIWMTLFAAWLLTVRFIEDMRARLGSLMLLACWLTLPIAGTSLMLMDSYVTARSFTTPLTLLALAWALDGLAGRRIAWLWCALSILLAALLHPLMAGYGLAAVACVAAVSTRRLWPVLTLSTLVLVAAAILQAKAPTESLTYQRIALTRYYWFLSEWHWYELLGVGAPLLLLFALRKRGTAAGQLLAEAMLFLGAVALIVSTLFAHETYAVHLVARLQPLRAFQILYELMILLLGAWLGDRLLQNRSWRWATLLVCAGTPMFYAQRSTFPNSTHVEWPGGEPANPWQQAFVWIRGNTPTGALFALDARYITQGRHEDAQCFRAIAERSALPDYSKDGGEASITPALTDPWTIGVAAQSDLETESDMTRSIRLRPLKVSWIVLESTSQTAWPCLYQNSTVKVCHLP